MIICHVKQPCATVKCAVSYDGRLAAVLPDTAAAVLSGTAAAAADGNVAASNITKLLCILYNVHVLGK
jgi:hypothetical protein